MIIRSFPLLTLLAFILIVASAKNQEEVNNEIVADGIGGIDIDCSNNEEAAFMGGENDFEDDITTTVLIPTSFSLLLLFIIYPTFCVLLVGNFDNL